MKTRLKRLSALLAQRMVFLPGIGAILLGIGYFTLFAAPDLSNPHLFKEYISGYSSGIVSAKSEIKVLLNFDMPIVLDSISMEKEETSKVLEFTPSLKGKLVWTSRRQMVFRPEERMENDQEYFCTVDLEKLNPRVPRKLREFTFKFKTKKQDYRVSINETEPINFESQVWQRLKGTIQFNDIPDTTDLRKMLVAQQDGRTLKINWEYNSYDLENAKVDFSVDSVERKQESTQVKINADGDKCGVSRDDDVFYHVVPMGQFGVVSHSIEHNPEQCLVLSFSDPIKPGQSLNNIIRIEGQPDPRCVVMGTVVKVYPQTMLTGEYKILISTALKNAWNFHMNQPETVQAYFEPAKPNIRMVTNGVILPNSGQLFFPFEAVAVKAVEVTVYHLYENNVLQFLQVNSLNGQREIYRVGSKKLVKRIELNPEKPEDLKKWKRYAIDLSSLFKNEPGAMYRIQLKMLKKDAIWECASGEENGENSASNEEIDHLEFNEEIDLNEEWGYQYDQDEDGDYSDQDPCSEYYYQSKIRGRNVLVSDLGVTVKQQPDKEMHVVVNSLMTAEPIKGAIVQFYNFQQQVIQTVATDNQGMANCKMQSKPFVAVAKFGNQKGYVKTDDGSALSLSNFDVDGAKTDKGIRGFIYGERGVWRPGDSLFLNFILEDPKNVLPPNYPVSMELIDPAGRIVKKIQNNTPVNDFYDFRTQTDVDAPTGFWLAKVNVGNKTFTKNIRIETVKPNRLKIYLTAGKEGEIITSDAKKDSIQLSAKWLHGAIAKNLNANVEVTVTQSPTSFKKFPNYHFDDPTKKYESQQQLLFNGKLNAQGEVRFNSRIESGNSAPGFLKASFITRVFEEGGDFSVDRFSTTYSTYRSYAGLSTPSTNIYRPVIETGKIHEFGLASVSENGESASSDLQVKIFRLNWEWWWDSFDDDVHYYLSRPGVYPVYDSTFSTKNGKAVMKYGLDADQWGRYLVRVTDKKSGHTTGKIVFFDSPYWSRSNNSNTQFASMLSFSADKENYRAGEDIQLSIPSSGKGRALISIENGEKILKKFWVNTEQGETKVKFKATGEMGPVAYIFVSLIQPHGNVKNDLPMRMYGIIPVNIEDPARELHPEIKTAKEFSPESVANIQVKELNGKAMTYTLAVVDEGLLDLTRFKTPNPRDEFYQKEALGIKTWDLYDYVIGAYGGKLNKVLSIGGDGSSINAKGAKANRFRPVVRFIGPFKLNAGQTAKHKIEIPQYVGSVRIMVVAGENGAYGNAEVAVPVKKPLMVLATLPRVLGPGEEVELPVNVFAMESHIKQVKIRVETNEFFEAIKGEEKVIKFNSTGDEVVNFRYRIAEKCGIGKVKVIAESGNERAVQTIEIDVRPLNPVVTSIERIKLNGGMETTKTIDLSGLDGTNDFSLEASLLPVEISKRLSYLIGYPHGCIEQTTSSAFPQLAMQKVLDLTGEEKQKITVNVKAAIQRIGKFQTSSGGFAYWPGMSTPNNWGTNYAGHFLIEAERAGYVLPNGLKTKWVDYQKRQAQNWSDINTNGESELEQAYRLYVLALSRNPETGAMNRLRELKNLNIAAKWRLAAAYCLNGQPETARSLTAGLSTNIPKYNELSGNFGTSERDAAMILQTMILMKDQKQIEKLAIEICENINSNKWMSTQTTAWSLLALNEYMNYSNSTGGLNFSYQLNDGKEIKKSAKQSFSHVELMRNAEKSKLKVTLKNEGKSALHFRLVKKSIAKSGEEKQVSKRLKMALRFMNTDGKIIPVNQLTQGTDFIAEVILINPERKMYEQMSLTQIFPSGWEIRNSRMDAVAGLLPNSDYVYQDIRDDRVSTYFSMAPMQTVSYKVLLNAAYQGRFYLPGVLAEAMYDNNIQAVEKGFWIEVKKQEPMALK